MFRREHLSIIEIVKLRIIRRRVREGDIGGADDGMLTTMERRRLEFERFLRIRRDIFREDER